MTFGTKKGHFNAHKIAPVSNSDLFFFFSLFFLSSITHDYTFTRRWAINSTLNIPGGWGVGWLLHNLHMDLLKVKDRS